MSAARRVTASMTLDLAAGRLYLPGSGAELEEDEAAAALAAVGHVYGPAGDPCVALLPDGNGVEHWVAALAVACGLVPAEHPHRPWGVLMTSAANEKQLHDVRDQLRESSGELVVCYVAVGSRGDAQGADLVRSACHDAGAGFILTTTEAEWDGLRAVGFPEFLPAGTALLRVPPPSGRTLRDVLREQGQRLAEFHAVRVEESALDSAIGQEAGTTFDVPLEPLHHVAHPTVGAARLRQWAFRAAVQEGSEHRPRARADAGALAAALRADVVGQDDVVLALASQVAIGLAGLRSRSDRPCSAVLLTGPTGTGKSLLAQTLARSLGVGLVRVDLAAYTTENQVATLLGSPPGYVGSTNRHRWLTTQLAAQPGAVLLLDEVDKAHPDVAPALLLELLGAGTLTDQQGRTVDCRRTHVVLTANTGATSLVGSVAGFGSPSEDRRMAAAVRDARALFTDELYNRLDEVLVMGPLARGDMETILTRELARLRDRLALAGYRLTVDRAASALLLEEATDAVDGVRRLHRTLERRLAAPILRLPVGRYVATVDGQTLALVGAPSPAPGGAASTLQGPPWSETERAREGR